MIMMIIKIMPMMIMMKVLFCPAAVGFHKNVLLVAPTLGPDPISSISPLTLLTYFTVTTANHSYPSFKTCFVASSADFKGRSFRFVPNDSLDVLNNISLLHD